MDKTTIDKLFDKFESCCHRDSGVEIWMAKDLQTLLGYIDSRDFFVVLEKAKLACQDSRGVVKHNFVPVRKLVRKNGKVCKVVGDHKLTRLACYFAANNCGFNSDAVTFAQSYFAVPIRRKDVIEKRILEQGAAESVDGAKTTTQKEESVNHIESGFEHGMDFRGFGSISSKYGGKSNSSMRRRR